MSADRNASPTPPKGPLWDLLRPVVGLDAAEPVWQALRQALMASLPNTGSPVPVWGEGPDIVKYTWRQLFYPDTRPTPLSRLVGPLTGFSDQNLATYSTAILCQNIYYNTDLKKELDKVKIEQDINKFRDPIMDNVGLLGVTAVAQDARVVALAKAAKQAGMNLEQYEQKVLSVVESRLIQSPGQWPNGDLEVFEWLGKYLAMGGTTETLGRFLDRLYAKGLPQWPTLTAAEINHYRGFIAKPGPTYLDFPESQRWIVYSATVCSGPWTSYGGCTSDPYQASGYFLNSEVAKRYYVPPPSSCCSEDTEVLLADGSARRISELKPGELIAGPEGPIETLYVSAAPLAGRELHEFLDPGVGPRITPTHPVVHAVGGDDGPAVLSVDAAFLRAMLPNHHRTGVGTLGQDGRPVYTRTVTADGAAGAAVVTPVDGVPTTDTATHGDDVFDVVLPFSQPGRPAYWAGRRGTFVLVESELVKLSDDPFAGAALFELIAGVAGARVPESRGGIGTLALADVRSFFEAYGRQVTRHALQVAMASDSPPAVPDYELDELGPAIDAFVRGALTTEPAAVAAVSVLLEACSRHLYTPLSNLIRSAWRAIPTTGLRAELAGKTAPGDHLALSFFDLEIAEGTDLFADRRLTLRVGVRPSEDSDEVEAWHSIDSDRWSPSSGSRHVFDGTIGHRLAGRDPMPRVSVEVLAAEHSPPVAAAFPTPIPVTAYGFGSIGLRDAFGRDVAWLNYDSRKLSAPVDQLETEPAHGVSDGERLAFAATLGRAMVEPVMAALYHMDRVLKKRPPHYLFARE